MPRIKPHLLSLKLVANSGTPGSGPGPPPTQLCKPLGLSPAISIPSPLHPHPHHLSITIFIPSPSPSPLHPHPHPLSSPSPSPLHHHLHHLSSASPTLPIRSTFRCFSSPLISLGFHFHCRSPGHIKSHLRKETASLPISLPPVCPLPLIHSLHPCTSDLVTPLLLKVQLPGIPWQSGG